MKKILSFGMTLILLLAMIPINTFALDSNIMDDYFFSLSSDVIEEKVTTSCNGLPIYITRRTYPNNSCTVEINENGVISSFACSVDFQALYQVLTNCNTTLTTTSSRATGYVYTPMKTEVFTDYLTPENGTYSKIFAAVSLALSPYSLAASSIAAVASLIYDGSYSSVKTKLVTTMDWYIKTLDGEFVSYHCKYSTATYVLADSGAWMYIGTESGTMESLTVW